MTDRMMRITSCDDCPHQTHKGGFGDPKYIPYCQLAKRDLPYEVRSIKKGNLDLNYAHQTEGIPDWCPLEVVPGG